MKTTDLIPVSDKLHIVNSPTEGKFPMAFSFLVLGTDTHALIDTGCGPRACRHVIEKYGVDMVINSHCHPDHVSSNHLFAGKELLVPEQRVEEVGAIQRLAQRLVGPDQEIMDTWKEFVRQALGMRSYKPTRTFQHGEILDFGGISFQAVHTPGHLDDHYCFLEPRENALLSFDMDLTGFGPFYGNPESDIARLKNSLNTIMDIKPRAVISSHRLPVRENILDEIAIFADKISRNEERVASVMTVPRSLDEICAFKPIFGKYIPGLEIIYSFFEKCMVLKHLEGMQMEGKVRFEEGKFFLNRSL
jgi:glyoxylase-like metal-dependent hydrolase (beta-lactamase superfamily II)